MGDWNRERAIEWFKAHQGRVVRLGQAGTALHVGGRNEGVDTLDACATEFDEVVLDTGVPGVQVSVTFHDEALGLHVLGHAGEEEGPSLSLPAHVPYDRLELSEAPEGRPSAGPAEAEPDEEEPYSPYELLFRGSR